MRTLLLLLLSAWTASAQLPAVLRVSATTNAPTNSFFALSIGQVTNSMRNLPYGPEIRIPPGTFYMGAQPLALTNGVKLIGSGIRSTVLLFNSASTLYCVQPGDNCYVANLTIQCTNPSSINIPLGLPTTASATNVFVENVELDGKSDCIYVRDNQEYRFKGCIFRTAWDACFQFGGLIQFYDCTWQSLADSGVNNQASITGIRQQGGTNRAFGGTMVLSDGVQETLGVWCISGRSELRGLILDVTSNSGRVRAVTNSSGTIVIVNCFPNAPIDGTNSSSMNLLSVEGSFGREIRNITTTSGRYTNSLTDRFIQFDVSAAAGTNTLPDIGYKTALSCIISNQPTDGNTFTLNGTTYTWKNSPIGTDQIQIGTDQSDSAFWLSITVPSHAAFDPLISITQPTVTNVTFTSRPDNVLTHSASGTWSVRVLSTNDYATTEGRLITVKDYRGSAATRNITVKPQRLATVDGASSYVINANYGAATFQAVGTNWSVIAVK